MCSATWQAGQGRKVRSAADRLCHGLAEGNRAKAVTEPDRRRSLDSRAVAEFTFSSHRQECLCHFSVGQTFLSAFPQNQF